MKLKLGRLEDSLIEMIAAGIGGRGDQGRDQGHARDLDRGLGLGQDQVGGEIGVDQGHTLTGVRLMTRVGTSRRGISQERVPGRIGGDTRNNRAVDLLLNGCLCDDKIKKMEDVAIRDANLVVILSLTQCL
jgi:hypothetical protein